MTLSLKINSTCLVYTIHCIVGEIRLVVVFYYHRNRIESKPIFFDSDFVVSFDEREVKPIDIAFVDIYLSYTLETFYRSHKLVLYWCIFTSLIK